MSRAAAVAKTRTPATIGISMSQDSVTGTSSTNASATTTTRPSTRLAAAVSEIATGIAARGKDTLRSRLSRWTKLGSAAPVASAKKLHRTIPSMSMTA